MRSTLLAALFLCLAVPSPAEAGPPDDRYVVAQGGTSAPDVLDARKCPPPFSRAACKRDDRVKKKPHQKPPKPPRSDFRAAIAAMVDAVAHAEGVPSGMARALVRVESGGYPGKRGAEGEWGLTQIKCQTARGLGFSGACSALADPVINLRWGLRHARRALDRGSIGFHQAGLHARRTSPSYVARIHAAMR